LIPDPTTGSIRFYNKIKDRLSDEFEKVTGPDYQSALFFFLK
jgi:hypothetical protein